MAWVPALAAIAASGRPLVAADGGANHLARIGLRPDAVVGDLDSITPSVRAWVGEERLLLRPDQESTDLEKTLAHVFDAVGAGRLTVLGALGGRVDHTVGNLGLVARLGRGADLVLREPESLVLAVAGEAELEAAPGETWSAWSFDPGVRVTLEGFRWPVAGRALDAGGRPSISNLALGDRVRVLARGGPVLLTRHLTPPPHR
jgi:thiamine pyrophosphokinase